MDRSRLWARVDNRLVHGQVIETWLPYSNARSIVVGNDELAQDPLQQEIIKLAVPQGVEIAFCSIAGIPEQVSRIHDNRHSREIFLLFYSCEDAKAAFESGVHFHALNIGNLHYSPGKKQICDHIALSQTDMHCLRFFQDQGIKLDFRCVPNIQVQIKPIW
ncbi:MAG: PTS sugar transporter subunit IIB [Thermodesulfobacteriota bacterium]